MTISWDSVADGWLMKDDEINGVRVRISVTPHRVEAYFDRGVYASEKNYFGIHIAPYPPADPMPAGLIPLVGAIAKIDSIFGSPYVRQYQTAVFDDEEGEVTVEGLYSQFNQYEGAAIICEATLRTPKE